MKTTKSASQVLFRYLSERLPTSHFFCQTSFMRKLITFLCLTLPALMLTSMHGWSADLQRGWDAVLEGDYATALYEWRPLAEQGSSVAQFNLGVMYDKGQGVPRAYETAVKWYTLSAEQGHAAAQFNLGNMYDEGQGVIQDYQTAVKWYTLAAEHGNSLAQTNLGVMYDKGKGVVQNYVRAHMWFNISASQEGPKSATENRDVIADRMTPSQIETAQDLALECVRKNYKGC